MKNCTIPCTNSAGDLLCDKDQRRHTNIKTKKHPNRDDLGFFVVDHVATNAKPSSHFGALHNILEDNEAEIKMIIKGRSPTMRHVSRTHRVALDWLFDRINVDTQNQKSHILIPKNQLADMLTKGNVTRDEWNHLLRLFNIMNFSIFLVAISVQLTTLKSCRRG